MEFILKSIKMDNNTPPLEHIYADSYKLASYKYL